RSHQLLANSSSTTTLPPPCSAPMALARVPLGIDSQSMVPNGAASTPAMTPATISAYATDAVNALLVARWMMSNTTDVPSRPSGNTTSIWWTGWPSSLTLLSMAFTSGDDEARYRQLPCHAASAANTARPHA